MILKNITPFQKKLVKKEVDRELKSVKKKMEKDVRKKVEAHLHKKLTKEIYKRSSFVASKFKDHATTAIIAALSFIIAIAWKDLIVKFVGEKIKFSTIANYPYLAELYSAIIVTIFAVIGIIIISTWATKKG